MEFRASEEINMTTIASLQQSSKCIRCGERLTSPDRCTYVDEEFVCYFWVCLKCGCEFEASTCLYQDASVQRSMGSVQLYPLL